MSGRNGFFPRFFQAINSIMPSIVFSRTCQWIGFKTGQFTGKPIAFFKILMEKSMVSHGFPLRLSRLNQFHPRLRRLGRCGMGLEKSCCSWGWKTPWFLEVSVNTLAFHGDFMVISYGKIIDHSGYWMGYLLGYADTPCGNQMWRAGTSTIYRLYRYSSMIFPAINLHLVRGFFQCHVLSSKGLIKKRHMGDGDFRAFPR